MVTHAFITPCSGGQARRGSYRPVVTVRLSEKAKQEKQEEERTILKILLSQKRD